MTMELMKKKRLLWFLSFLVLDTLIFPTIAVPVPDEVSTFTEACEEEICKQWEEIDSVNVEDKFRIGKYRSKRTNLTVVLGPSETPIVNGYFCLATEAFDDDGLPHTLEHLIFRGSEDYPYKETLDGLASRCLADRTNAWTAVDHTCYTVYTAGAAGFLTILPVYMDHILYPLLREEDYITEVHHVTGEGKDSGVVYSEMQARENKPNSLIWAQLMEYIYPGNSSYHSKTGGKLSNLRESTSNEKIRAYHKQFYRPDNLYLTITGMLEPAQVFKSLDRLESKILSKREGQPPLPPLGRPFQRPLDPLVQSVTKTMRFPSKDEKFGRVAFAWRLPGILADNVEKLFAFGILSTYLTSTAVSPLKKRFVEIDEPLATSVYLYVVENWEPAIVAGLSQVPVDKMEGIEEQFQDAIQDILDDGSEKFDVERIGTIIDKMMLARQVKVENGPQEVIPSAVVADILYSTRKEDLSTFLKQGDLETAQNMKDKPAEFWLDLLKETVCRCNGKPRIKLLAYPNANYNKEIASNETRRVEKQKKEMGEEGLKQAALVVKEALESTKLPPKSVLLKVPFADVNSMTYHTLKYYNYTTPTQPEGFDLKSIPFRFQIDDIDSEFVRIYMFIDTSDIDVEDQMYLSLLSNLWLQCPLKTSDGKEISFEEVTKQREKDALSFYNYIGGSQSQFVRFVARLKLDKYEDVVKLFQDALFDVNFTNERAKTRIARVLNSIPAAKQDAGSIVGAVYDNIYFNNQTYLHASSFLRQKQFLEKVKQELDTKPESLINKLQELRRTIVKSKNTFVYMSTDLGKLTNAHGDKASKVWKNFFKTENENDILPEEIMAKRYPITPEWQYRDPNPKVRHAIVGLPGTESCYLKQAIDFDMHTWESKELAATRLMLKYLTNVMYDQIRGQGWTYGIWAGVSVTGGRLGVSFVKASDLVPAYKEFRKILTNYSSQIENENIWDPIKLDSARGSLIYSYVATEETPANLASSSISTYLRGADDAFYSRRFVKMLSEVTADDVKRVAKKYLHTFFYPKLTYTSVVCSPKDIKVVKEMLNEYKIDLNEIDDLENSILTEN